MVQVWSTLASGDTTLLRRALSRFSGRPPTTSWATYLRCHDDIGWAIDDTDAADVGLSGPLHRAFLSDWYAGQFPGSPARGLVFQENAVTGDRRISGTTASLLGVEAAGDDVGQRGQALERVLLAHLVLLGWGGLPVLWMGDELALVNDAAWAGVPEHADDNRWVHRPVMPWDVVEGRDAPGEVAGAHWSRLRHAARTRSGLVALHASVESEVHDVGDSGVLVTVRRHPQQLFAGVYEVTGRSRTVPRQALPWPLTDGPLIDALTGEQVDGDVVLDGYQGRWLVRG